jgi:hypothetical protein
MRRIFAVLAPLFAIAGCGGEVVLTAVEGSELSITANPTAIPVFNGVSTITVVGFKSQEDGGGPLTDGTQIFLTTTVGIIEERVEMRNGVARGYLRSNGRAGVANIVARSGAGIEAVLGGAGEGAPAGVLIGNAAGINILLTANPPTITPPNNTTELVATVFDNDNNRMPDVPIIFTTSAGSLASMSTTLRTNAAGQAIDRLTLLNEGSATVTAFSGAPEGGIRSNDVTVNRSTQTDVVVASVSPTSGAQGTTLSVTVSGANFQPGAIVSFGEDISVNSVTFVNSNQLVANITIDPAPQNTSSARTVTVINPDGSNGNLPNAFRIITTNPAPVISSLFPTATATRGAVVTVTINGFNFDPAAQVSFSSPAGSVNIVSTTFNSSNQIEVDIIVDPAPPGGSGPPAGTLFQVRVQNPDGLLSNSQGFTTN